LVGVAVLILASNVFMFRKDSLQYLAWGEVSQQNSALIERFRNDPISNCAVFGSNTSVRAYLNLSFRQDLLEFVDRPEDLILDSVNKGGCAIVVVYAEPVFTDLPRITTIAVFDTDATLLRFYEPTHFDVAS